jgi:hypothetical protein
MKITEEQFETDHQKRNAKRKAIAENKMSNKAFVLWCILWVCTAGLIAYNIITNV